MFRFVLENKHSAVSGRNTQHVRAQQGQRGEIWGQGMQFGGLRGWDFGNLGISGQGSGIWEVRILDLGLGFRARAPGFEVWDLGPAGRDLGEGLGFWI